MLEGVIDSMSSVTAPAREKKTVCCLVFLHHYHSFMTPRQFLLLKNRVCLRLFVCPESGKRKGCKNSRVEVLRVFYGPPTLGINCHEGERGGGGRGGGGVVTVKEEEESDGAAVIYEVIQDSVHWCQRG